MKRGDVYWAELGGRAGKRPVVLISRSSAVAVRTKLTVVRVTTRVRGIPTEVALGPDEGLVEGSVANCDELTTISKRALLARAGSLRARKLAELDQALRFALGIASWTRGRWSTGTC